MVFSKAILIQRLIRIVILLIGIIVFLIFFQKTNHIETIVVDSHTVRDTTKFIVVNNQGVTIKSFSEDDFESYFYAKDLSKTIYRFNMTDDPCLGKHELWLTFSEEIVEPSPIDSKDFKVVNYGDVLFVETGIFNKPKDIEFYVRDVAGENKQYIRNFFITEILGILVALFFFEFYRVLDIYMRYKHKPIYWDNKDPKLGKKTLEYLLYTIATILVIWRFNVVRTVEVTSSDYTMNLSSQLYSMYDISCMAFDYHLNKEDIKDGQVKWSSNEIVEFHTDIPNIKSCSMKEIAFEPDADGGFHHSFVTENLESSNFQDIRMFIAVTLLAIFFSRFVFLLKEYIKEKHFNR